LGDAGDERGKVQRDDGDRDKLERSEHYGSGA